MKFKPKRYREGNSGDRQSFIFPLLLSNCWNVVKIQWNNVKLELLLLLYSCVLCARTRTWTHSTPMQSHGAWAYQCIFPIVRVDFTSKWSGADIVRYSHTDSNAQRTSTERLSIWGCESAFWHSWKSMRPSAGRVDAVPEWRATEIHLSHEVRELSCMHTWCGCDTLVCTQWTRNTCERCILACVQLNHCDKIKIKQCSLDIHSIIGKIKERNVQWIQTINTHCKLGIKDE